MAGSRREIGNKARGGGGRSVGAGGWGSFSGRGLAWKESLTKQSQRWFSLLMRMS